MNIIALMVQYMAGLLGYVISLRPAGIHLLLKANLGLPQSEGVHAEHDSEKTDTAMTSVSAESALCHR